MSKVGLGIITCDRPEWFGRVLGSVPKEGSPDELVAVNDGSSEVPGNAEVFRTPFPRSGVAAAKNIALRELLHRDCDWIFLIEDDILIRDSSVFDRYIRASLASGIQHFNFALHSNVNRVAGRPLVKFRRRYGKTEVWFYPFCVGAFSMYSRKSLDTVGFMAESFYNAIEHQEHTYRIAEAGLHPPYHWFADIADSGRFLQEIDFSCETSVIRRDKEKFMKGVTKADRVFREKHGCSITEVPSANVVKLMRELDRIEKTFGKDKTS